MELTNPSIIKELLAKQGGKPSKKLGQNFLIEPKVIEKIIAAANISKQDTVLEIGPGIGTLTTALAEKAGKVIAIEQDDAMIEILQTTLKNYNNIEIIRGSALDTYALPATPYKLVANIPYYITSPIIRKFLESPQQPESLTLMVQREVAQRICTKAPNMNLLAVSVQFYATPAIITTVPKGCFWPSPNVDSAVIQIIPNQPPQGKTLRIQTLHINPDAFFSIVKAGFSAPRKQLAGNLADGLNKEKSWVATWLAQNNINPKQRAETLSMQDWINLANSQ